MVPRITLAPLLLVFVLTGCAGQQVTSSQVLRALTPETMQIGVTAPNLINGPTVANKGNTTSRRDAVGTIGLTVSVTYRLKAIRIERAEVQPVRVVAAAPVPTPSRASTPHGERN